MPTQFFFFITWPLILTVNKMLKEDINHGEEMANFLNEYKQDDQTLKLVKDQEKEFFVFRKTKVKIAPLILILVRTLILSAPLLKSILNMTSNNFK